MAHHGSGYRWTSRPRTLRTFPWILAMLAALTCFDDARAQSRTGREIPAPGDIDLLLAAVKERPDDSERRRRLAFQLMRERRYDEALEELDLAVRLAPGPESLLELALAYGSVKRDEEALATFRRVLEVAPDNPVALVNVAKHEFNHGQPERAVKMYRRALEIVPSYLTASKHLGDVLKELGRSDEALEAYDRALKGKPTNPREVDLQWEVVYEVAALEIDRGNFERAERLLVGLLEARPDHESAHYVYAQLLLQSGREEQAATELELHARILKSLQPQGHMASKE